MPKHIRYKVKKYPSPRVCNSCYKNIATYLRGNMAFCGNCLLEYVIQEGKVEENITYSVKDTNTHMDANNMLKHLVNIGYIKEVRDE